MSNTDTNINESAYNFYKTLIFDYVRQFSSESVNTEIGQPHFKGSFDLNTQNELNSIQILTPDSNVHIYDGYKKVLYVAPYNRIGEDLVVHKQGQAAICFLLDKNKAADQKISIEKKRVLSDFTTEYVITAGQDKLTYHTKSNTPYIFTATQNGDVYTLHQIFHYNEKKDRFSEVLEQDKLAKDFVTKQKKSLLTPHMNNSLSDVSRESQKTEDFFEEFQAFQLSLKHKKRVYDKKGNQTFSLNEKDVFVSLYTEKHVQVNDIKGQCDSVMIRVKSDLQAQNISLKKLDDGTTILEAGKSKLVFHDDLQDQKIYVYRTVKEGNKKKKNICRVITTNDLVNDQNHSIFLNDKFAEKEKTLTQPNHVNQKSNTVFPDKEEQYLYYEDEKHIVYQAGEIGHDTIYATKECSLEIVTNDLSTSVDISYDEVSKAAFLTIYSNGKVEKVISRFTPFSQVQIKYSDGAGFTKTLYGYRFSGSQFIADTQKGGYSTKLGQEDNQFIQYVYDDTKVLELSVGQKKYIKFAPKMNKTADLKSIIVNKISLTDDVQVKRSYDNSILIEANGKLICNAPEHCIENIIIQTTEGVVDKEYLVNSKIPFYYQISSEKTNLDLSLIPKNSIVEVSSKDKNPIQVTENTLTSQKNDFVVKSADKTVFAFDTNHIRSMFVKTDNSRYAMQPLKLGNQSFGLFKKIVGGKGHSIVAVSENNLLCSTKPQSEFTVDTSIAKGSYIWNQSNIAKARIILSDPSVQIKIDAEKIADPLKEGASKHVLYHVKDIKTNERLVTIISDVNEHQQISNPIAQIRLDYKNLSQEHSRLLGFNMSGNNFIEKTDPFKKQFVDEVIVNLDDIMFDKKQANMHNAMNTKPEKKQKKQDASFWDNLGLGFGSSK